MNTLINQRPVPPERLAEAGVWVARLHGDERGQEMEAGFRQWLRADPLNARAFELTTDVWNDAENLKRVIPFASAAPAKPAARHFTVSIAAAAAVLLLAGYFLYLRPGTVATNIGEQRLLVLEDGTRVYMNTATRLSVAYDTHVRRVELRTGEAFFDVARKADRPFVVTAGERTVVALGTSFVVRREDRRLAVTLVEGKVAVTRTESGGPHVATGALRGLTSGNDVFTLVAGQRLTLENGAAAALDTPAIEKTTAWRHGQVVLDDTPLSTAIAEMNRYSRVQLSIQRPEARNIKINGLFQAGDSASFANAVAQTYGLQVREKNGEIVLTGLPANTAVPAF